MSKRKTQSHISKGKTDLKLRAYLFSLRTIKLINELPNKRVFWVIGDQLLRSSTSIGANIVEAKSSSSKREFIKYYEISLKSANETKYWLCLLRDSDIEGMDQRAVKNTLQEAVEIGNMLGSSLLTMKGKR
ncbi:MAG: hypothetical protein A2785_03715 [Candidatus Chisholmbacteria bacterium RIFCSPHIGHO2_01_FULL_49_18]|uniref:Four helix bundle protein n=2 Tax=Candidatus Chisholmiibacteriota TaxID=1817900 RepID=A0A1G1VN80_9BACT|nr:MAG: hypothetical protein A2785_03715 [Candidatus Chisholmbacteria bacterium RIFCSPHIGHO2_01_FULL_49_18]OGY19461.1 MAG: hypothetical protein A3A65_06145 [Candidatus Chisholmbacteria bacterium RIFCSPLOWO2_01_FULL_49_14]